LKQPSEIHPQAFLTLEDGIRFSGNRFGTLGDVSGEVVFNTGMVGYPESLTDPSYYGQILVFTYPLIGNYAIPNKGENQFEIAKYFESPKIQVRGVVVSEYCEGASHHRKWTTLDEWLKAGKIPGLFNVDTRRLTQHLRDQGVKLGRISENSGITFFDPNRENAVQTVSRKEVTHVGSGSLHLAVMDCGIKNAIIRQLLSYDTRLSIFPFDADLAHFDYDGLLISNGPGDPAKCTETIAILQKAMKRGKPIFGICLGHQLLALAAGAQTYKLKFGHRSHNQPCALKNGRAFVTSQNHGYAVDQNTLPADWTQSFYNTNDGSNEGIRHTHLPFSSVQFHPEAASGPQDTAFLFEDFISLVKKFKQ
jgi:carbamoyl-phosphate synthase small subunit